MPTSPQVRPLQLSALQSGDRGLDQEDGAVSRLPAIVLCAVFTCFVALAFYFAFAGVKQ